MGVFATPAHLVSWAKFCPQVKESAGKRKGRNSRGKANRYIAGVLGEASVSVGRTQTRLGARYRRLAKRRGKAKAQVALGNAVLTIAHALFSDPTAEYHDLGADYYEAHTRHHHQVNDHLRALQRLGYKSRWRPLVKLPEPPSRSPSQLRDSPPAGALPRTQSRADPSVAVIHRSFLGQGVIARAIWRPSRSDGTAGGFTQANLDAFIATRPVDS